MNILHPFRMVRFWKRAAFVKRNDPEKYKYGYRSHLCCVGKLVVERLMK